MIKIFGTATCAACKQKIEELKKKKIKYKYYDINTSDGLAEAAYYEVLGAKQYRLPIIIEIIDE